MAANPIKLPPGFELDAPPVEVTAPRLPPGFELDEPTPIADAAKSVVRQVGLTGRAAIGGLSALPSIPADALNTIFNLGIEAYNKATGLDVPKLPMASEALERTMTRAGLPEPETATERVVYDVNKALTSVVPSVGAGQVLSKSGGEVASRVGQTLAYRPATQAVAAASGAGGSSIAEESGASVPVQMGVGLASGVVGGLAADRAQTGKIANAVRGEYANPRDARAMALSDKHDVPLSYGDIKKGAVVPKIETGLEQTPLVGMGGFREAQHSKAMDAAKRVVTELDETGEEWAATGVKSLAKKATAVKRAASRRYDDLAQIADTRGAVGATKTMAALDDAIAKESDAVIQDKGLISALEEIKTNMLDPSRAGTFSRMRDFRSDLGSKISDYYNGKNAIVGAKGVAVLQKLRNALDDDMEDFAKQQGGEIYQKWKSADLFYKNNVVPLREQSLARLANTADPDELYRRFLTTAEKKPETLYRAIGPAGRSAVRYGMVREAYDRAMSADGQKFSPAKFAKYLEDHQSTVGVFFKGRDKEEIDGFMNLMRYAERAGQYMENPPTGNRLFTALLTAGAGAGAVGAPVSTAVAGGSLLGMKMLFTTEAGKKLLLAASKKPSDKLMDSAIRLYGPAIGASVAQQGNRDNDSAGKER